MNLNEYLKSNKIKGKDFAPKIGVSQSYLTLIRQGKRWPRPKILRRIITVTNGQVMPNDIAGNIIPLKKGKTNALGI